MVCSYPFPKFSLSTLLSCFVGWTSLFHMETRTFRTWWTYLCIVQVWKTLDLLELKKTIIKHQNVRPIVQVIMRSGPQIFQESGTKLKILDARRATCSISRTEGPHILGASIHSLVSKTTWLPGFLHLCPCVLDVAFMQNLTYISTTA